MLKQGWGGLRQAGRQAGTHSLSTKTWFDPQNPHKNSGCDSTRYNPTAGEIETDGSLELTGQPA